MNFTKNIKNILKQNKIKYFSVDIFSLFLWVKKTNFSRNIVHNKEYFKKIKNWIYTLKENDLTNFEVSQIIDSTSYISLESALSYYSIIPDRTVSTFCITTKKTNKYNNDFWTFFFRNLPEHLFFWFDLMDNFFIAEKEKAILDYLYLNKKLYSAFIKDKQKLFEFFESERFQNLENLDFEKLFSYTKKFKSKPLNLVIQRLEDFSQEN